MARKILLADDSVTAQNMGRKILADAGYEVITVNNGSAALKKIAEHKPDLVLLDVYMPGYSGLEVCQRLKEAQETARTPVLLTVGKLEPFKPEEAKRVRAEGFIVKPFEASELLSALSKLEDKIVPRAEPSKPGRFARAIAAVEESGRSGRGGESDEDSGWKKRIAFPSKKKGKPEKEDGDDPAIYNAVNRDLRTVVDHGFAPKEHDAVAMAEDRVDVAALGAPGVREVSAEEIAAIAAAAAQVQASSTAAYESAESRRSDHHEAAAEGQAAASVEEGTLKQPVSENKLEVQSGAAEETVPAEGPAGTAYAESPAATFAETTGGTLEGRREEGTAESRGDDHGDDRRQDRRRRAGRRADRRDDRKGDREDDREEDRSEIAHPAAHAEAIAAIAALEPSNGDSWSAGNPAFSPSHSTQEIPVTMAVGSSAAVGDDTRWMAVPVAIDPDEAAISLELEMQKAYAAFAAAEANSPGFVTSIPEVVAPSVEAISPSAAAEPVVPSAEPELANAMNAVASASAEALGGAVAELAAVAESHTDAPSYDVPGNAGSSNDGLSNDAPSYDAASKDAPSYDAPRDVPPESEPSAAASSPETTFGSAGDAGAEIVPGQEVAVAASPVQAEEPGQSPEQAIEPIADKVAEEPVAQPTVEAEPVVAETTAVGESAVGGMEDMAEKTESEMAASTAAAWASWRQIRESAQAKGAAEGPSDREFEGDEASSPADSAAMAAAAGAEKAPEEASATDGSDPAAIASIVDSVLADLRPKIVEEISRKLGKKK